MIDSRTPSRSAGTESGSKPGPAVLDENFSGAVGDFQVHRDGAAAVAGGVQHGLTGRLDQGLVAFGHGAVPDADHFHGVPQRVLHLRGGGLDAVDSWPASWPGSRYSQPRSSRSCARASRTHVVLVAGTPLDQGQGLQHGVVQVGGDLGPLGGTDHGRRAPFPDRARTSGPREATPGPRRPGPPRRPATQARSAPRSPSRTPSPAHRRPRAPARPRAGPSRRPGRPWSCPRGRPGGSRPAASRRSPRRPGSPRPGSGCPAARRRRAAGRSGFRRPAAVRRPAGSPCRRACPGNRAGPDPAAAAGRPRRCRGTPGVTTGGAHRRERWATPAAGRCAWRFRPRWEP